MPTHLKEGVRYSLVEAGGGDTALVMLHGLGNSLEFWDPISDSLSIAGAVVCPDIPGFGMSETPVEGFNLTSVTNVLADWLESIGLSQPILCGHSMGAVVALSLAKKVRPSGMILLNGTFFSAMKILHNPLNSLSSPAVALNLVCQSIAGLIPMTPWLAHAITSNSLVRSALLWPFAESPSRLNADLVESAILGGGSPNVIRSLKAAASYSLEDAIAGLACPLAVISTSEDRLASPSDQQRLHEVTVPFCELTLKGLGHWPMLEDPETTARAIESVYASLGPENG